MIKETAQFYFVNYIITLLRIIYHKLFFLYYTSFLSGILCNLKVMSEKMCKLKRMLGRSPCVTSPFFTGFHCHSD